jgi:ABC-type oligopeptide transport system substrate-binding subunit
MKFKNPLKNIYICFLCAFLALSLSGCGDSMSKLAKENPDLYQIANRLSKCAGVQLASGQIANREMMQQNADNLLAFTANEVASYGVTANDLRKIAEAEAKNWQGITLNNSEKIRQELRNCSSYMRSITNK